MNTGTIIITVTHPTEEPVVVLEVDVTGTLNTAEAVGYMELAKLQHLDSMRAQGPTVFHDQVLDASVPLDPEGL